MGEVDRKLFIDGVEISPELIEGVRRFLADKPLRPRWSPPAPQPIQITPRVVTVLEACNQIKFSRSSWLFARVNKVHGIKNLTNFLKILGKIHAAGLIKKVNTKETLYNANYQPDVYTLTNPGRTLLQTKKVQLYEHPFGTYLPHPSNFNHALGVCDILHSAYLGADIISQDAIFKHKDFKELRVKLSTGNLTPDAIFGIRRPDQFLTFYALEFDRGTESQKVIAGKLAKYRELIAKKLYQSQWGLPNLWPLFVTTTDERKQNMMAHLKGHSVILFKAHRGTLTAKPPASPHIITEPWSRQGYPEWWIK